MGKDIFGAPRFHCTVDGCTCADFISHAAKDLEDAEAGDVDREELESKYHNMTCQAKSEYQLFCAACGHNVSAHSTKERPSAFTREAAGTLFVLQGVVFRKDGAHPEQAGVKKLRRATGTPLETTGRCWRGPSGGLWAELSAPAAEKTAPCGGGWALIEGPGFGVEGPLLSRECPPSATPVLTAPEAARQLEAAAAAEAEKSGPACGGHAGRCPGGELTLPLARELLGRIDGECRRPEFQEGAQDPLLVGGLFVGVCAGLAAELGFGAGEEGVRKMLVAVKSFTADSAVEARLADIEESLHLGPGSVLAIADAM